MASLVIMLINNTAMTHTHIRLVSYNRKEKPNSNVVVVVVVVAAAAAAAAAAVVVVVVVVVAAAAAAAAAAVVVVVLFLLFLCVGAMCGVMVSTSVFLACHQCSGLGLEF